MKICFYGVGGVGGYFGTLVTQRFKDEHGIYFIARGKHKDFICKNGLTLKRDGGAEVINVSPEKCTDNIHVLPVCDIIILSVKGYDLVNAVNDISVISSQDTIILPLLNGVDIYERIRKYLDKAIVLPSCVYIGTYIESPGIISQDGGDSKILIGYDPMFPDFYPESILNLLKESKINFNWEKNIQVSIWSKYMFIAAYGLVTATYDKTVGEVLESSELSQITKSIMKEIEKIAKRLNIPLDSDIVDTSFFKAKQFPFETRTSFQRDVESKGKTNEADIFGGTIIRYGDELGIPVPNTRDILKKLMAKFE
jgi:2-dehydropantoate 2-reductase